MHRARVLAAALVVLAAPPALAEGFATRGSWVLGGGVLAANAGVETKVSTTETWLVEVSPELTWFLADRLALRATPGVRYAQQRIRRKDLEPRLNLLTPAAGPVVDPDGFVASDGTSDFETWLGLGVGPVYYLPLADALHLGLGAHLRYDFGVISEAVDAKGFGYGAEAGLAVSVGTGGVVELGGRYTRRALTRNVEGAETEMDLDLDDLLVGFRFGVVL